MRNLGIELLNKIADNMKDFTLTSKMADGRLNSALDEEVIIAEAKKVCNQLNIEFIEAPVRFWYDFAIKVDNILYPVNVKITTCGTADNTSSKEGMFYALTGIDPKTVKGINTWEGFNRKLYENLNYESNSDYYFMVIRKSDHKIIINSLLGTSKLVSNGNNLPFQIKWNDNLSYIERPRQEAISKVLATYFDSWAKKSSPFLELQKMHNRIFK